MKKATQTSASAFHRRGSGAVVAMARETYRFRQLFRRANDLDAEHPLEIVERDAFVGPVNGR